MNCCLGGCRETLYLLGFPLVYVTGDVFKQDE